MNPSKPLGQVQRTSVFWLTVMILVASFVAFPTGVKAQRSTASINGTVRDSSGAVVPDATVVLQNVQTGIKQTVAANATGDYVILNILPGNYTLEVTSKGFVTVKQNQFTLVVNQTATFDFQLTVGSALQTITVQATAARLEASTAELGAVVSQREVNDLPLNGRNFTQMLSLAPGVSPVNVSQNAGGFGTSPIGTFEFPAVNGQTNRSNLFMLDGIMDLGSYTSTYGAAPVLDDIQEFKLQSHNDEAQFGGALGGIVNVVTKGGGNQFHGSGWEFVRNDALDSRNFFASTVAPFKQNQFGGTIGGPVILPGYNGRNRTFFFASYDGFRKHSPSEALYRVPTAAELSGDLSDLGTTIYNPFSTRPDPANPGLLLRDPFPNSQIPSNLISPNMVLYASTLYPAPVATGFPGFNGIDTSPTIARQDLASLRFDEQISARDVLFVRYTGLTQPNHGSGGQVDLVNKSPFHVYNVVASETHTFGGSGVMTLEFGRTSLISNSLTTPTNAPPNFALQDGFSSYSIPSYYGYRLVPNISIPGFAGSGDFIEHNKTTNNEFKGDVSKIFGRHTFKMGADISSNNYPIADAYTDNIGFSSYETSNLETSQGGSALASFLLGVPDNAMDWLAVIETEHGGWVDSFYFEDQWKVTDKLTANLGFRYDITLRPIFGDSKHQNQYNGDLDLNNGTYILANVPPSCSQTGAAPCIPGGQLPANVVKSPSGNGSILYNTYDNWQPRIGLAYRLRPSTAVRVSYGRFFDNWASVLQLSQNYFGTWPSVSSLLGSNLNPGLPTASALNPLGATSDLPGPTPFNQVTWFTAPHIQNPYSDQWNLGMQQQLSNSTVLTANYVGSHSSRLDLGTYVNAAVTPGPGNPQERQPYPYITPTYYDRSIGRSNYNAFQFALDRKSGRGLTYLLSYTWSKSMDVGASGWFGSEGTSIQNPYDLDANKSVSGFDLTHIFSFSWVYQLPIGNGRKWSTGIRGLDHVLGNWQVNGITSLSTGPPYDIGISGDIANTGMAGGASYGYERLNYLGGPRTLPNPTPTNWINTSAFAAPAPFTFGNLGRNSLRADWARNLDFSIFRDFPITETKRVQFRFESFNLFNTPVFGTPDQSFTDPTFGQVFSTANSPRQLQFGLKFYF